MLIKNQFMDNRDRSTYLVGRRQTKLILKSSFKSRNYIKKKKRKKKKHGPYFEVSAIQASTAVLYTQDLTTQ